VSACNSIVPGVQSLIAKGFVDPKALGLQGQSLGEVYDHAEQHVRSGYGGGAGEHYVPFANVA
jgi:hypothetical protein